MTTTSGSRPDWRRKIRREHVVTFTPFGAKDQGDLHGRVAEGLRALGYEVDGKPPISINWRYNPPNPRIEITYSDGDRIGLDSWENAVVCALADADAFGQVEAYTRITVLPNMFAPEG